MHFAVAVYYKIVSKFQKLEKKNQIYSDHKKKHKPGE